MFLFDGFLCFFVVPQFKHTGIMMCSRGRCQEMIEGSYYERAEMMASVSAADRLVT